jgi:hypothetical protein
MSIYSFRYLDADGNLLGNVVPMDCGGDDAALAKAMLHRPREAAAVEIWHGEKLVSQSRLDVTR